jgi:hypothetical protein
MKATSKFEVARCEKTLSESLDNPAEAEETMKSCSCYEEFASVQRELLDDTIDEENN